jgi:predicted transcriptional regulator
MGKKRDRIDIIADMLSSIQQNRGEIKPTHLMYKSNLSHVQMTSYLEELLKKNFIKKIKKSEYDYIIITDHGHEFLAKLREMKEFETAFGL